MGGLTKIMIATTAVVLLAGAAAVFLIPPAPPARMARRHARVRQLLDNIVDAIWAYHREKGEFPPEDGIGSAGLVRALGGPSGRGRPYLVLSPEMVTSMGDLRNPLAPETSVFYYRLRSVREGDCPGTGFRVWCLTEDGTEIGSSDWAPVVSSP